MPRTAGRTSARSSASRDQANSPPKQSSERQLQSPRRTRSGRSRSQSVDLGGEDHEIDQILPAKRRTRQGSVESVDSNASAASNREGARPRKTANAKRRNLATVTEDREEDDDDDGDDSSMGGSPNDMQRIHSPSSASQMSGTTAYSAGASYSTKEVAAIDPRGAEMLPELCTASRHILNLLAPPEASKNKVESIAKDLKISGSGRAKSLKEEEDRFKGVRALYGSDFDTYIQMRFVSRKLLGNQIPKEGPFRPDAVIYTANLAAMVKEFLVFEQKSPTIREALMDLEKFPEPFLRSFDAQLHYGSSALFYETFEMVLDIRTHATITALRYAKEQDDFDPDSLLVTQFFIAPAERDEESNYFDDVFNEGIPKGLPGGPAASKEQITMMKQRVLDIRSTFRDSEDAQDAGDLVDFEQLEEMFPWLDFLTQLVNWSRKRLVETSQSIKQQGGLEIIKRELMKVTESINGEAGNSREMAPAAQKPRQLQPAAEISYPSLNEPFAVGLLQNLKRGPSSLETASSNPQSKKPRLVGRKSQILASDPDTIMLPEMGGGESDEILPRHSSSRPTAQYTSVVEAYGHERNKENRPNTHALARKTSKEDSGKIGKIDLRDRQINTEQVRRRDQETSAGPSIQNSSRQDVNEEEVSEDEGFEADKRAPDVARRRGLPPATVRAQENSRPSKRARDDIDDAGEGPAPSKMHGRTRAVSQQGPRPVDEEDEEDEDDEENSPPPTYRQINRIALSQNVKARIPASKTQKRIPWSDEDVQYLIEGIEEYGCKWSLLWKMDGWEVKRDQVALKDKGRNLVVNFHRGRVPLPMNFDQIAIGKKEIAAIQKYRPDWEPEN